MTDELKVAFLAIVGIVFLEFYALHQGMDGAMWGTAVAGIGGIAGYLIKSHAKRKRKRR